jgi:hypothetical protein
VRAGVLASGALLGCGDTGQTRLSVALSSEGNPAARLRVGDADFSLSRADVAFGPAYFCATVSASPDLCEVALLELRETVVLDGIGARVDHLASLQGTTGEIRSALYDFGLSWLLTRPAPEPAANAPEGHSALISGDVARAGQTLHFEAAIDIAPRARGDSAMNAQRTRHVLGAGQVLKLTVDPTRWLSHIDVDALFARDTDGDGAVVLAPEDQAFVAIVQGMQNSAPVSFTWEDGEAP